MTRSVFSHILNKYHMENSNHVAIPSEVGIHYSQYDSDNLIPTKQQHMQQIPYKQVFESLQ